MKVKKLLASLLAASMLVACSGSGNGSSSTGQDLKEGDTVKIGFIGPLTGDVSSYGIPVGNSIQMVVDEYNADPNSKYKVELLKEDTGGSDVQATSAYKKLVGEGIVGIVGPVITAEGLAVGEASKEDKTPIISSSTTGDTITLYDDGSTKVNYFRACSNDALAGQNIASAVANGTIPNVTKVATLTNSGSEYSQGGTASFKAKAEELGVSIVSEQSYPDGTTDFSTYVNEVMSSGADAVYIPDYYETNAIIVQKFRSEGYTGAFLGTDGWDGVLGIKGVDKQAFNNSYYITPYNDTTDEVVGYVEAYKAKYNGETNQFGTMAYDATWIMLKAIESAESTDPEKVIAALQATKYDGITGHFEFDDTNTPTKDLVIKTIKNGEYSYLDD